MFRGLCHINTYACHLDVFLVLIAFNRQGELHSTQLELDNMLFLVKRVSGVHIFVCQFNYSQYSVFTLLVVTIALMCAVDVVAARNIAITIT